MLGKNQKVDMPLNGARAAIATLNNGTVQWQDREQALVSS